MPYDLSNLIDIGLAGRMLESFCNATGSSAYISDGSGKILYHSSWKNFCTEYHHKVPELFHRCKKHNKTLTTLKGLDPNAESVFTCPNGLKNMAVPVVLGEEKIATLVMGQFWTEKPDPEALAKRALTHGIDLESYLDAANAIPVFDKHRLDNQFRFLKSFADYIANAIFDRMRHMEARRVLEEMLKSTSANEQRYRRLVESSKAVPWEVDTRTGKITYISPQIEKILGYPHESWTDISVWKSRIHPDYSHLVWQIYTDSALWGHDHDYEYKALDSDGRTRWLRNISSVMLGPGGPVAILGFILDITEQKSSQEELDSHRQRLEEMVFDRTLDLQEMNKKLKEEIVERTHAEALLIAAKEAAEAATKAKGEFLANMSHELRTPMNAVIGMTHLALKSDLSPTQENYVRKILSSATSLLGILNDILDFSKIEAGKLTVERVNFTIGEVISNVVNVLDVKAQEKGLNFTTFIDDRIPATLVGDPLRLGQVLLNLTGNAIKFTPKGCVRLTAHLESQNEETARVCFTVMDSGMGISQDVIQKIYEPFVQGDASITRKHGGTGLGLSITKRLVALLGGNLEAESKVEEGSRFFFALPLKIGASESPAPRAREGRYAGLRALVIDDSDTSLKVLSSILKKLGITTTTMRASDDAVELVKKHPDFDIIMVDIFMPYLDGFQTKKLLDDVYKGKNKPIFIALTAHDKEETREEASKQGMSAFILKPFSANNIAQVLAGLLAEPQKSKARDDLDADKLDISGNHVLLVEDNLINQEVAKELLESFGLTVSIAQNGLEALAQVKTTHFDAVLMDIQMPIMDGITATRALRAQPDFKTLPIIAMTAHAMAGDREKSLEAGMNDHITKPVDPAELKKALFRNINR